MTCHQKSEVRRNAGRDLIARNGGCRERRGYRKPWFIQPSSLRSCPMDHVLELVRQHTVELRVAGSLVFGADEEQLLLVGKFVGQARVFVRGGEVPGHAAPGSGRIQDVQSGVSVHTGVPLAAKEFAIGGVDVFLEVVYHGLHIALDDGHPDLGEEIHVLGLVDQLCRHLLCRRDRSIAVAWRAGAV